METKANNFLARKVNMIVLVITAGGSRLITRFSFFKVKMNCNDSIQPLYISIGQPCLRVNSRYPASGGGMEQSANVTSHPNSPRATGNKASHWETFSSLSRYLSWLGLFD